MKVHYLCAQSYPGSGRPSRMWVVDVEQDEKRPTSTVAGPFASYDEAMAYIDQITYIDASGYWQWREPSEWPPIPVLIE